MTRPAYPAILGTTFPRADGGIGSATPIADVWIQGVPCRAGAAATFHRNGQLAFATLARTHVIDGEALPAGAQVGFETDGHLSAWTAARDAELQTRALGASGQWLPVTVPAGSHVTVERGQLRSVTLAAPLALDGMAFPAGTELVFGDSGALSHVTSPEALDLRGIRWVAHEPIVFERGHLREGYPEDGGVHGGVPYQRGEIVRLHDSGALARCYLGADTAISGVLCAASTRVYLDERGDLLEGSLATGARLGAPHIPVEAGGAVALVDGALAACTPCEDIEIDGVACAKGALVELGHDGHLVRATLARPLARAGWTLPAGTLVVFAGDRLRRLVGAELTAPDGRVLAGTWRVDLAADGAIRIALPVVSPQASGALLRTVATIGALTTAARTSVELDDDGAVRSLVLASDQRVAGYLAKGGTRVHFHEGGRPATLYLAEDTRIDDVPCAAARTSAAVMNDVEHTYREQVRFHESGALAFATLAADATVAGVPLARAHTIARWPDGTLQVGTLAERYTHPLGCIARAHTLLGQFEEGSPSVLTLAEPFTLAGTEYAAGSVLGFEAPGVLRSVESARVPLGACAPVSPASPP